MRQQRALSPETFWGVISNHKLEASTKGRTPRPHTGSKIAVYSAHMPLVLSPTPYLCQITIQLDALTKLVRYMYQVSCILISLPP